MINNFQEILLVGKGGVGKTTFLRNRLRFCTEPLQLSPFIKSNYSQLVQLNTTKGEVVLAVSESGVIDIETDTDLPMGEFYEYSSPCAVIIMFEVGDPSSLEKVISYYNQIREMRTFRDRIVICGNKIDLMADKEVDTVHPEIRAYANVHNIPFCFVSAKTNYNIGKPFTHIIQAITGDSSIQVLDNNAKLTYISN